MMILIILIAMFIVLSIASNKFMTWDNMSNLMKQTSINGVVAIGMTFVIISSGIDLRSARSSASPESWPLC